MRIQRLEIERFDYQLDHPISISFHTFDIFENFLIRLYADDGLVGWGEGAPFKPISGDCEAEAFVEAKQIDVGTMPPLETPEQFCDQYISRFNCPSLRAALDQAAHDLLARQRNIPAYQLYAPVARPVPNTITVFLSDDPAATQADARRIIQLYPHLQLLKIKLKGQGDEERCQAIKQVAPPHLRYVLDANQGFTDPDLAVKTLRQLGEILGPIIAVEQPCPVDQEDKMRYVHQHLGIAPVLADESCRSMIDLERIIRDGSAAGINIKLQKVGGITPARRLARRAEQAGLMVMIGCHFEHPLAIAAGVHLAVVSPNVRFADLDMDLDLPLLFNTRCPFDQGMRHPLPTPGFGLQTDESRIAALPPGKLQRQ